MKSTFEKMGGDVYKRQVSSSEMIETIADKLTEYHAKNIVVDPVMVATSGARLISEDAIGTLDVYKRQILCPCIFPYQSS